MVGLSLLTLVPGQLGGTETYVRELTRALAAHGELEYRVYVPPVAAGAGNGLPEEVVREYRPARTLPQRFTAMARAGLRQRARGAVLAHDLLREPVAGARGHRRDVDAVLELPVHRERPRELADVRLSAAELPRHERQEAQSDHGAAA